MESALLIAGSGILLSLITELSKRLNLNPRGTVFILAVLVGVGAQVYKTFLPADLQEFITVFFLGAWGTSVIFYDYVITLFKK